DALEPELVTYAKAGAPGQYFLYDEPDGLVIRAMALIRDADANDIAILEVGARLNSEFLKEIKTRSTVDLALIWKNQVRAATVDFGTNTMFPTTFEVDNKPGDVLIQNITANSTNYYGIFRVLPAQRDNPGLLAVLVPTEPVEQAQRALVGILILIGFALV